MSNNTKKLLLLDSANQIPTGESVNRWTKAAAADVTMAVIPKEVKTGDVVTELKTHAMTLSGKTEAVTLFVALYDAEGKLTKVKFKDGSCNTVVGSAVSVDLTGESFATYKTYVWGGNGTLSPIEVIESYKW